MVAKRKDREPTWQNVKAVMANIDLKQLYKLIADLYRLSNENKIFIHSRLKVGDDLLGPYKKEIEEYMYPDVDSFKTIQILKAKKAISSYSKAIGDPKGEAELMTFFVECGNNFTVNYGDIDEAFYDSLNRMFRRAIDKVLTLPKEFQDEFKERLEAIMTSSSDIGWGYHDTLCDDYYEAFPENE